MKQNLEKQEAEMKQKYIAIPDKYQKRGNSCFARFRGLGNQFTKYKLFDQHYREEGYPILAPLHPLKQHKTFVEKEVKKDFPALKKKYGNDKNTRQFRRALKRIIPH